MRKRFSWKHATRCRACGRNLRPAEALTADRGQGPEILCALCAKTLGARVETDLRWRCSGCAARLSHEGVDAGEIVATADGLRLFCSGCRKGGAHDAT